MAFLLGDAMRRPQDKRLEEWIRELFRIGKIVLFYKCDEWRELRAEVLEEAHNECQYCVKKGIYTKAVHVHHVNEVRKRPDLALSKYYRDEHGKMKRNLVALCHNCHDIEHDRFKGQEPAPQLNEERW